MTEATFQNWEAADKKRNGRSLKRLLDIVLALVLLVPVIPALAVLYVVVLVKDGRPFIYRSRRNTSFDQEFDLMKIRTMRTVPAHENVGITGGHKKGRITKLGRYLRNHRLDELPQLWNVLKGEMSFVGPRPPEPRYVAACPEIYQQVLLDRPGITGMASIIFHSHEEKMLAECNSQQESEDVYVRRCIPRKAHLDMIYHRNKSPMLDIYVLYLTAAKLLPLPGRRAARIRGQ